MRTEDQIKEAIEVIKGMESPIGFSFVNKELNDEFERAYQSGLRTAIDVIEQELCDVK